MHSSIIVIISDHKTKQHSSSRMQPFLPAIPLSIPLPDWWLFTVTVFVGTTTGGTGCSTNVACGNEACMEQYWLQPVVDGEGQRVGPCLHRAMLAPIESLSVQLGLWGGALCVLEGMELALLHTFFTLLSQHKLGGSFGLLSSIYNWFKVILPFPSLV